MAPAAAAVTSLRAAASRLSQPRTYHPIASSQRQAIINQVVRPQHISSLARRPVLDSLSSLSPAYSTMASQKKEFLVIVNDNPGMLAKRQEVRDTHLNSLGPVIDSGFLKVGGAMFDHHPKEGETPPFKGSMLITVAESEQEVRDTMAKDIYATSGVWDIENVFPERDQITPVARAEVAQANAGLRYRRADGVVAKTFD